METGRSDHHPLSLDPSSLVSPHPWLCPWFSVLGGSASPKTNISRDGEDTEACPWVLERNSVQFLTQASSSQYQPPTPPQTVSVCSAQPSQGPTAPVCVLLCRRLSGRPGSGFGPPWPEVSYPLCTWIPRLKLYWRFSSFFLPPLPFYLSLEFDLYSMALILIML